MTDDGYLLLAIADDFLAEYGEDAEVTTDEVYTWLIGQAQKVGGAQ